MKKNLHHWTMIYIFDRVLLKFYEILNPDYPWLTQSAIKFLDKWLKNDFIGLEFGSGRSTVWFSKRVHKLTSIEHDPVYYNQVKAKLYQENVDYRLCGEKNDYISVLKEIQDASLDFCLIDGKHRDLCALSCISKIKPNGILILDNCNIYIPLKNPSRSPGSRFETDGYASNIWKTVGNELKAWQCIWTSNGIWDTAIWVKPN